MRRLFVSILMLSTISVVSACGGGGGGGAAPAADPTTAVVKIMTSGSLAPGALIGGIDVTLNLPAGVTVVAAPDATNTGVLVTQTGVLAASGASAGANATVMGTYTAAPNAVSIKVINPAGFGTGEFVTVSCDIAAGTTVTAADFSAGALSAADLNGAGIAGLTAGIEVTLQ